MAYNAVIIEANYLDYVTSRDSVSMDLGMSHLMFLHFMQFGRWYHATRNPLMGQQGVNT
jgi:hypothetical protein